MGQGQRQGILAAFGEDVFDVVGGVVLEFIQVEVERFSMPLLCPPQRAFLQMRYLQNNVIAYHDQAWGDGDILLDFRCSPGIAVDRYRSGHKTLILISLRQVRNRGDKDELQIEWAMKNGFTRKTEEWTTSVSHRTRKLRIKVTFPAKRPPLKMLMIETNRRKHIPLGKDNLKQMPDGRWLVSWEKEKPHLYEDYTFRWDW